MATDSNSPSPSARQRSLAATAAWIVYGVVGARGNWLAGSAIAAALMLALLVFEYRGRALMIIDCTSFAYFIYSIAVVLTAGPPILSVYNVATTWIFFAVVMWATLVIRYPFTVQYAREQAPREVWDHPIFMRLNVILSIIWALIMTIDSVLGVIALHAGHQFLFYLLQLGLMGLAFVFSAIYPKRFAAQFATEATTMGADAR